jgi:GTPase SAR1 family protein
VLESLRVGNSFSENVGKTTLIRKLNPKKRVETKKFKEMTSNVSTDGIDVEEWQMNVVLKEKKKQLVNFSVWDFAGQGNGNQKTFFTVSRAVLCKSPILFE